MLCILNLSPFLSWSVFVDCEIIVAYTPPYFQNVSVPNGCNNDDDDDDDDENAFVMMMMMVIVIMVKMLMR